MSNNYKASGYEAFTEKTQARNSGDRSHFPPDRQVSCPITGRMVIGRWDTNIKILNIIEQIY